ncbi:dihydroxyacetone kinase subunit DhaL [Actinobacillus pleuropneumoniae]|uniref:PTS-dependent dihydroxyacetone kinase, ADP-binding subunit DhaL n=1 Tax=Actinobacillus pleuropneumoniae serovar 6 str. Femo TaxID=754256 RepID=A0A828Q076_ACTPL|nr:dihydroxyacetone kinase subunit DhaL [Actinobacillus pleuropneumoniae]EFL81082.1 dihydroxyacetone kinase ADP-binding subunit [Actinobacillus pleuropneumoniae serovar 6 str. Femo]EFM92922.1 PTS-dependent dihydroxyacetone kinase, ADP-binding subunit DhaL [Actinobacillus pleuropneumoniae serovar 6 str. Femo]MEE3683447.1 dihydroxyacetone kinase subunit DhaL [Actinobacillus pleuropneumoniae]UKH12558.1 dihydroxyacetone kinase ADP-binding subunit DhaL [Actinobacillus pleuropneumoniae serovar 6 str.
MAISKQQILQWLENCNQVMTEQRGFLTQLDTEIGDGDHGLNMQRGFSKALEKIATVSDKDIGTILKTVGMTLLSQVGGASGPLYGTLFIKGSQVANGKEQLTFEELVSIFKAGVEGIIARGRAEPGDKTLCDVWLPLLDELAQADHSQPEAVLLNQAVEKAENFAKATVPMTAKKGRASYLGERSVGHADPGATSSYYLIKALAEAVK